MLPALGMVNDLGHFGLSVICLRPILQIKNNNILTFEIFTKYSSHLKKINTMNHF